MADVIKLGGFHGGGKIDGVEVLITSGSVTSGITPAYLEMVSLPKKGMAGRVIHSDGTAHYEATLGFDMFRGSGTLFSANGLLKRGGEHTFSMSDGYNGVKGSKAYVTSATIQASSGGIISGNVSFVLKDDFNYGEISNIYHGSEIPLGYWTSGGGKIADWSLSMSQDASPMYANKDEVNPHYIKIGLVTYELTVTSYEQMEKKPNSEGSSSIKIGTSDITLEGNISETGYEFGGTSGLGTFRYRFSSGSKDGKSNTLVIS